MSNSSKKFQQNNFNGGLMSDLMSPRVDFKPRFAAGTTMENFIPTLQGSMYGRPGTKYIGQDYYSNLSSPLDKRAHIEGLTTASGTNYLVEFSEYLLRFWKEDDTLITDSSPATISSVGGSFTVTFNEASSLLGGYYYYVTAASGKFLPAGTSITIEDSGSGLPTNYVDGTTYYVISGGGGQNTLPTQYKQDSFLLATSIEGTVNTHSVSTGNISCTLHHSIVGTSAAHGLKLDDYVEIDTDNGVTGLAGRWAVKSVYHEPQVVTLSTTTEAITLSNHGLVEGDEFTLLNTAAGAGSVTLGSTRTYNQKWYVKDVIDANSFTFCFQRGGPAENITGWVAPIYLQKLTKGFDHLQLAPIDGNMDFSPARAKVAQRDTLLVGVSTSQISRWTSPSVTIATNIQSWRGAGTYGTPASDSTITVIGKHTPYSEADLFDGEKFDCGIANLGDSMYISHGSHYPRKLTVNSDEDWDFDPHAYGSAWYKEKSSNATNAAGFSLNDGAAAAAHFMRDGPWVEQNFDDESLIKLYKWSSNEAWTRYNNAFAMFGSLPALTPNDAGRTLRSDGAIDTAGNSDPTWLVATEAPEFDPSSTNGNVNAIIIEGGGDSTTNKYWRKGLWFDEFPRRVAFVQDRVAYAGMTSHPTRVEMSETSNYQSFSPTDVTDANEVLDTNAISLSIAASGAGVVNWTVPTEYGVLVGCSGGIYHLSGQDSGQLVPGAVSQTLVSNHGADNIRPIIIGSEILYVQIGGQKIRKISLDTVSSEESEMSRLFFDAIASPISGWVFQAEPNPTIWCTQEDGTMIGITAEMTDQIFAAHTHTIGATITGGDEVESVAVIRDSNNKSKAYFMVKRTVDGATVRYLEKLTDSLHLDPSLAKEDMVYSDCSSETTAPAGSCTVAHLANETNLVANADGVALTGLSANGSGVVSMGGNYTKVKIGLPYTPAWESMDVEYPSEAAFTLGKRKRINEVDIGFYKTVGAKVGRDSSNMNDIDFGSPTTTNESVFTGVKKEQFNGCHTEKARVRIEQSLPQPICVTTVIAEGEIYD